MTNTKRLHRELSQEDHVDSLSIPVTKAANLLIDWLIETNNAVADPKPLELIKDPSYGKRNSKRRYDLQ